MKVCKCVIFALLFVIFISNANGKDNQYDDYKVKDQLGRNIKLNQHIYRIISFAPSITEIIFALGAQDKLVGVTKCSNYPLEASNYSIIGSYTHPDLEKIIALKPDLCLAIKDGNPRVLIERLDMLDIPVYVLDPKDFNSVLTTILDVGFLLNCEIKANSLVKLLKKRVERVKNIVSKSDFSPRIFFQIGAFPIISAGNGTFIDDMIRLINGINIINSLGSYPRLNQEDVLTLIPDVIIITAMANDVVLVNEKYRWETWSNLPANVSGNIFVEDSDLFDRPSPRLIDGLEILAKRVYPKLFEELS